MTAISMLYFNNALEGSLLGHSPTTSGKLSEYSYFILLGQPSAILLPTVKPGWNINQRHRP
jgi:hypothetical protein